MIVVSQLFVCFLVASDMAAIAAEFVQEHVGENDSASVLVSPDWLEKKSKTDANLRIIDLAFRKTNYLTGHIPGAVFVDWRTEIIDDQRTDLYRLPTAKSMEKLLSRIGVNNQTTIVLTDNLANRASVRMYYTLKYFRHDDVKILNGGTNNWVKSGRRLTTAIPATKPAEYQVDGFSDDVVVKLEAVQAAISTDVHLVDGRPADQYRGDAPGKVFHTNEPHQRLGHVPTAVNIPWNDNLNDDGTFKSFEQLRRLYESHGIRTDDPIIAYCNEGLHAAMPWFIFRELFGNEKVRVYDDSMAEWANQPSTPLELDQQVDQKN